MRYELFLQGLLVAVVFGVPAGAIGVLTIQRTLRQGFAAGFLTGLGASFADLLYASVGIFGLSLISGMITKYQDTISILGGILMILIGFRIFRKTDLSPRQETDRKTLALLLLSSFSAAILNPATVGSFLLAFSAMRISGPFSLPEGILLIAGIFLGSLIWWLLLAAGVSLLRNRITERIYRGLNRLLGGFLILFGATVLLRSVL